MGTHQASLQHMHVTFVAIRALRRRGTQQGRLGERASVHRWPSLTLSACVRLESAVPAPLSGCRATRPRQTPQHRGPVLSSARTCGESAAAAAVCSCLTRGGIRSGFAPVMPAEHRHLLRPLAMSPSESRSPPARGMRLLPGEKFGAAGQDWPKGPRWRWSPGRRRPSVCSTAPPPKSRGVACTVCYGRPCARHRVARARSPAHRMAMIAIARQPTPRRSHGDLVKRPHFIVGL